MDKFDGLYGHIIDKIGGIGRSNINIHMYNNDYNGDHSLEVLNLSELHSFNGVIDFNSPEVVLKQDYTPSLPIEIVGETEVVLNNKKLTAPIFADINGTADVNGNTDSYGFWVRKGGNLTIKGNGIVESQKAEYSIAVYADGGDVNIYGGKFYNHGNNCDLIYAKNGAKVKIYGGEFHPTQNLGASGTANKYTALNLKGDGKDGCEILVYGGTFYNFDPSNNFSESESWRKAHPNQFVADGYKSVKRDGEDIWDVVKE